MSLELPGWRHRYSGKVRDLYEPEIDSAAVGFAERDVVLVVASDRISAFDHILSTPVPDKGAVLTALSLWWFERLGDLVPHHVVSTDVPAAVAGRAMICDRLTMFPLECVARGYLAGSAVSEYRAGGAVCAVMLPPGLIEGSRLPEPIFTPARKAEVGAHDENVTFERAAHTLGEHDAVRLRQLTLALYSRARDLAQERGILLADTKFEFGRRSVASAGSNPEAIVLGDEVLTPDSSRFWPLDDWRPGGAQPSYDKQFVRDWLLSPASGWDRSQDAPPPQLPAEVVLRTRERYVQAYERLTGRHWS